MIASSVVLALHPEQSLLERNAVFAVLPLDVPVAQFIKTVLRKPGRQGQFRNPPLDRAVDAIRRRIANDPSHA